MSIYEDDDLFDDRLSGDCLGCGGDEFSCTCPYDDEPCWMCGEHPWYCECEDEA